MSEEALGPDTGTQQDGNAAGGSGHIRNPVRRELREVEKEGGDLYGTCPDGHGDENGRIAAEVSWGRRPYPNCPICGHRLTDLEEVWRNGQ